AERAAEDESQREGVGRERTALIAKTITPTTMASWRHVTTGVICEPIPHAAPVLYSRVSCRISPISGCGTSSSRFASAQFLVLWSATASSAAIPIMAPRTVPRLRRRRAPDLAGPALVDSAEALLTDRSSPACPASRW